MPDQLINPVIVDLQKHIAAMAPHQKDRRGGQLLLRSRDEIERLVAELKRLRDLLDSQDGTHPMF